MEKLRRELPKDRILIFDDLERSGAADDTNDAILGAINYYVEELGHHALIIAHSEKFGTEVKQKLEKTVGKTLEITANTEEAFSSFIPEIGSNEARIWLQEHSATLINAFQESGTGNLRLLRYLMFDLESLFLSLSEEQKQNNEACLYLLNVYAPLSMEIKAGNCGAPIVRRVCDAKFRSSASGKHAKGEVLSDEEKQIASLLDKYPNFPSAVHSLDTDTWVNIIAKGIFSSADIQKQLATSVFFAEAQSVMPWKVLWEWRRFTDEQLEEALMNAWHQIQCGVLLSNGDLLHTFAVLLDLADKRIIEQSVEQVEAFCSEYLEKIEKKRKIDALNLNSLASRAPNDEAYQRGFRVSKHSSEEAQRAFEELFNKANAVLDRDIDRFIKAEAEKLLDGLSTDPLAFCVSISPSHESSKFDAVSILAAIDHSEFLLRFDKIPPDAQGTVVSTIARRVEALGRKQDFPDDFKWACALRDHFLDRAAHAKRFRKERFLSYANAVCHPNHKE